MDRNTLNKSRMLVELDRLKNDREDYLTIYARPQSFPAYILKCIEESSDFIPEEIEQFINGKSIKREVEHMATGAVLFWSRYESKITVVPPFPVWEDRVSSGRPDVEPLKNLLERERISGLVLMTWGSYGVGVFRDTKVLECKKGTGHIHPKHRKGGSSQKRFARRTLEQKKAFLKRVASRVEEMFEPYPLEHIFFGGNRLLLAPLMEESTYLGARSDIVSSRFIDVRHADRKTLIDKAEEINSSIVFEL
ncbi:MAG: Vms1/Ankzf1 family peptidyl-tRNA hydrolase [Dehalococcoidales bacterium]